MTPKEKPKQTLEEAAERILANNIDGLREALKDDDLFFFYKGVIKYYGVAMAKWQAERMYSEEEVLDLLQKRDNYLMTPTTQSLLDFLMPEEWFKQFKKK